MVLKVQFLDQRSGSVSPRKPADMRILGSHPVLLNQKWAGASNLHFNKPSRRFGHMITFENH